MYDFFERVEREVGVIRAAPIAFTLVVMFIAAILYAGLEWFHAERYETQEQRIEFLNEQLQAEKESDKKIEERLMKVEKELDRITLDTDNDSGILFSRDFGALNQHLLDIQSEIQAILNGYGPDSNWAERMIEDRSPGSIEMIWPGGSVPEKEDK